MTAVRIDVGYQDIQDPSPQARAVRWTEDATGHTYWPFVVEIDTMLPVMAVADAVFEADNSPYDLPAGCLAARIREAMFAAYQRTPECHHSLSVGDRVRVSEVEVVCTSSGWRAVHTIALAPITVSNDLH